MRRRGLIMLGGFVSFAVFLIPSILFMLGWANGNSIYLIPMILSCGLSSASMIAVAVYNFMPFFAAGWVKRVLKNGTDAKAVVLENNYMQGVGYEGGDQWLELPVRVQPANEPAYEAKMKCRLTQIMPLRAGNEVSVRYDPSNKNRVVLIGDMMSILNGLRRP